MTRIPVLCAALLVAAAPALAGSYFVEIAGAYNQHDLGTVNEFLDSVNEEAGLTTIEHLDRGGSWSLSLGQVYERRLAVAVGYERLYASVRSTPPPVVMHIHAPANTIRLQLAYAVARLGPVIPFVQGGAGFIWNSGYLEYQDENGNNVRHDVKGSSICFTALAGAEVRLGGRYGLNLAAGYRVADIGSPDWDATSFGGYGTFTGPGFDYSGLMVRAGLRIGLDWGEGEESLLKEDPRPEKERREPTGWM